jgi:hypothetical protein
MQREQQVVTAAPPFRHDSHTVPQLAKKARPTRGRMPVSAARDRRMGHSNSDLHALVKPGNHLLIFGLRVVDPIKIIRRHVLSDKANNDKVIEDGGHALSQPVLR